MIEGKVVRACKWKEWLDELEQSNKHDAVINNSKFQIDMWWRLCIYEKSDNLSSALHYVRENIY